MRHAAPPPSSSLGVGNRAWFTVSPDVSMQPIASGLDMCPVGWKARLHTVFILRTSALWVPVIRRSDAYIHSKKCVDAHTQISSSFIEK